MKLKQRRRQREWQKYDNFKQEQEQLRLKQQGFLF